MKCWRIDHSSVEKGKSESPFMKVYGSAPETSSDPIRIRTADSFLLSRRLRRLLKTDLFRSCVCLRRLLTSRFDLVCFSAKEGHQEHTSNPVTMAYTISTLILGVSYLKYGIKTIERKPVTMVHTIADIRPVAPERTFSAVRASAAVAGIPPHTPLAMLAREIASTS